MTLFFINQSENQFLSFLVTGVTLIRKNRHILDYQLVTLNNLKIV